MSAFAGYLFIGLGVVCFGICFVTAIIGVVQSSQDSREMGE